jgi:outer membrane protein assembly factor BamB
MKRIGVCLAAWLTVCAAAVTADDWPEYRGRGRLGIWNETGILGSFPESGLKVLWRTPVHGGYASPSVADGRVFVADFITTDGRRGKERLLALDEKTGQILWTQEWDADYRGVSYGLGPGAAPTVDGDRVYQQGTGGMLVCASVTTGEILWKKDYVAEYHVERDKWPWFYGFVASPLVDGPRLIVGTAALPNAKLIALDKMTGKEIWRAPSGPSAITAEWGPGTGWPMMISAGGTRQLIYWHPQAIISLDPVTGRTYWEIPFSSYGDVTVAGPVQQESQLFFTTAYNGPLMLTLDDKKPAASIAWKGKSDSEIQTDGLHSWAPAPVIFDGYIYGVCSYGQFRCLNAKTGQRVWETQTVTKEKTRQAQAFVVRNGDRLFINNDRGELIIVKPSPSGYQEISRTQLIKPTTPPNKRRELVNVNLVHPAYANKRIYIRNDEEVICASLAARPE